MVEAGRHQVSGRFLWDGIPERLLVPPSLGLIDLALDGQRVAFPEISQRGQLWLRKSGTGGQEAKDDSLTLNVFRLIEDDLPQRLTTRLELDVSGKAREILLPEVLLPDFTALALNSPLPARLEKDGSLRLQIRPGNWHLDITARSDRELNPITLQAHAAPWPSQEVWAFQARNDLRQVEPTGLPRVDPRQTSLPGEWQQLPAFLATAGEGLGFRVIRRGDQYPLDDQLALNRTLWLDFNGQGYTFRDQLTGDIHKTWRLSTEPALMLGQVRIDNQPQFITHLPDEERPGVEIRRGRLNMQADSRYEEDIRNVPANGWNQDLQSVQATLNIPPGWRLFSANGIDNTPNTWLQRWTLLDIFLVLIAAIATARLYNLGWGAAMLLVLALSWHEPGAPQYSWLNLLAVIALVRLLPQGKVRNLANLYRGLSLIAITLIALPFTIHEVRTGIFPQLETHGIYYRAAPSPALVSSVPLRESDEVMSSVDAARELKSMPASGVSKRKSLDEIDPHAQLQTGPGLPDWNWVQIPLRWNGPVAMGQQMRLLLIPPAAVMLLKLLLSALLILMIVKLAELRGFKFRPMQAGTPALLLCLALLPGMLPQAAQASDFPDDALLKELRQRLLKADECLPSCAQVARAQLDISGQTLVLEMELQNAMAVAIPLPGAPDGWMPVQIRLDGQPSELLYRSEHDVLWLDAPAGVHHLRISGPLPDRDRLQLHFPLKPHYLATQAKGWKIMGLLDDGGMEANLELVREQTAHAGEQKLQPIPLPDFVRIERVLHLGLDWHVENRLIRLSAPNRALLLSVPLLPGEAVTTAGVQVSDHHVQINLAPGQQQMNWNSRLDKTDQIVLKAPESLRHGQASWYEVWELDVSPIWHVRLNGIPVIHQADPSGRWLPQWRPWPGEEALIDISRPQGIEGQTLTIDTSTVAVKPGKHATDTSLGMTLRSTRGGQHTIALPSHAVLLRVSIDGQSQNLGLKEGKLVLPIQPGTHQVEVQWRNPQGQAILLHTPAVDLGAASVNSSIEIQQGNDRWVLLTGGPRLGPAVLFWGVVLVLLIISIGLGMSRLTPLKTWHWFLLGIGLTQTPVWLGLIVVGWLLLLGARSRLQRTLDPGLHNAMQLGLALLSLIAIASLFIAVQQGLLGLPDMQIAGNNSFASHLKWYQDRSGTLLPQAWELSAPLLAYRLLMLAWALWLAFALLRWLRWGWNAMNQGGLWHKVPPKPRKRTKLRSTQKKPEGQHESGEPE